MTCCGTTREAAGKSAGMESGARSRDLTVDVDGGARGIARIGVQEGDGLARHRRRPFDSLAPGDGLRRTARQRHAPEMPPVDIVLVGGEHRLLAIRCEGHVLHFECAGRQQSGRSALHGDGVEVLPTVLLPGEGDAVARAPVDLRFGIQRMEDAAGAGVGLPDLPAQAIGNSGDADRPRLAGTPSAAARRSRRAESFGGGRKIAQEGDLLAVGRPCRLAVAIHRGIHVNQRAGREIVDCDKAMAGPVADVGQLRSIRRPARIRRRYSRALVDHQLRRARSVQGRDPDLSGQQVGDTIAFGRDHRRMAGSDAPRRFARSHGPDGLLGGRGLADGFGAGRPRNSRSPPRT